jgi:hypothetical protein
MPMRPHALLPEAAGDLGDGPRGAAYETALAGFAGPLSGSFARMVSTTLILFESVSLHCSMTRA